MNLSPHPRNRMLARLVLSAGLLFPAVLAGAQVQPAPQQPPAPVAPKPVNVLAGRPDADPVAEPLVGPKFESKAAGIAFRPPAGCKEVRKPGSDEIVEFINDDKSWLLRVTRPTFPTPVPLTNGKDANGRPVQGLLDYTINQLKIATPNATVLRQDVVNVDASFVGLITLRFSLGSQKWLRQQAMVQVNDQLYYVLNFTTPAGKVPEGAADDPNAPPDPMEKTAVETFSAVVDSIKILDRTQIKLDQNERLFRSRSLFVYWTPAKFAEVMVPRQFVRIIRDGKDVGYSLSEELPNDPKLTAVDGAGAVVYERSHVVERDDKDQPRIIDTGIFDFMTTDRRKERWTRAVVLNTGAGESAAETHTTEFGESAWETKKMLAPKIGVQDNDDRGDRAPIMRPYDSHALKVSIQSKGGNSEPVQMDLPPFYLPQAAWHLLPRLCIDKAFRESRTYLFAVYVRESKDLRMLYVDVADEAMVTFNGQRVAAIVVSERLGLEGEPTLHYVTSAGKYLGSENKGQKVTALPTDEVTILKIWPDANLTRPKAAPAPAAAGAESAPSRGLPPAIR